MKSNSLKVSAHTAANLALDEAQELGVIGNARMCELIANSGPVWPHVSEARHGRNFATPASVCSY